MSADISLNQASQEELRKRRLELADLEDKLADLELELVTLKANLRRFEVRYYRELGVLYVELDEIEQQIAAAETRLKYKNRKSRERQAWTQWAREQARRSERSGEPIEESKPQTTESLRKLFLEVAKSVHPDLAIDEDERDLRQKLMTEANLAYGESDEGRLQAVLINWKTTAWLFTVEGSRLNWSV